MRAFQSLIRFNLPELVEFLVEFTQKKERFAKISSVTMYYFRLFKYVFSIQYLVLIRTHIHTRRIT